MPFSQADGKLPYRPHSVEWTPEKIGRFWSQEVAKSGSEKDYFSGHSGAGILKFIEQKVPLRAASVLDYGSGNGAMLKMLLAKGARAQGLEFSEESVARVNKDLDGRPGFGGVTHATGVPTSIPSGSQDVVLLVEVLEHLLDDWVESTLAEIRRILRPGGHVLVTVPHAEDLGRSHISCPDCGATFHRWQHMRSLDAVTLENLMIKAGFKTVRVEATDFSPPSPLDPLRRVRDFLLGRQHSMPHLAYIGST